MDCKMEQKPPNLMARQATKFFKQSMKIYSATIPNAKFSPVIYRKIARDYFVLCTGQPSEQFNKKYPFTEFWESAGFCPMHYL